jgi:hypothetical protein
MLREPLLPLAAALAIGITIGHFHVFSLMGLVFPLALALVLLVFSFLPRGGTRFRLLAVLVLFLGTGALTQNIHRNSRTPKLR